MARGVKLISSMAANDFLLDIAKQYQVDTANVVSVVTVGGVEVMRRVKAGEAVAVRKGVARQDISSEAAVKKAVPASRSVGYSTGPSGVYLERLMAAWDPDKRVKRVQAPPRTPVGSLVAKGEVELGFQQLSALIHLQEIEVLGRIRAPSRNSGRL